MDTAAREIITLQTGPYASYVGPHWWNILTHTPNNEDLNQQILLSEGEDQCFTPRLVHVDFKSNQTATCVAAPPSSKHESIRWSESVQTVHMDSDVDEQQQVIHAAASSSSSVARSGALHFEPKDWPGYQRVKYHPKSLLHVNDDWAYDNAAATSAFTVGQHIARKNSSETEERLHFFAEECDHLQGFQILYDSENMFGGLASELTQHLCDEYKKTIFAINPLFQADNHMLTGTGKQHTALLRQVNTCFTMQTLSQHCCLLCPISVPPMGRFPELTYSSECRYSTSALLAMVQETTSSLYRQYKHGVTLSAVTEALSFGGRKIAAQAAVVPYLTPEDPNQTISLVSLSCEEYSSDLALLASRGVPLNEFHAAKTNQTQSSVLWTACLQTPCSTPPAPWTQMLSKKISSNGYRTKRPRRDDVRTIPVMSSLYTCKQIGVQLEDHVKRVSMRNTAKLPAFEGLGIEQDDFAECLENLLQLAAQYSDA